MKKTILSILLIPFLLGWSFGSGWDQGKVPASDIKVSTTNFDGNLTAADDTVQKALDTLDEMIATGGEVGGAPTNATYITQTSSAGLSAEQALSTLATGILKNTTTTGVLSIATAGTDYVIPSALHNAVTISASADTILSLSTQELGLDTQTANTVLAGPASGANAAPAFRALVDDDIPNDITITELDPKISTLENAKWCTSNGSVITCTVDPVVDTNTTYTASGSLLQLSGTAFSLKEGTLTNGKFCTYSTASGLVCTSDANNYSLPIATDSVLGGVKVGSGLTITSGVLSATGGGYTNLTSFVDQTNWRLFYSNGSGDVTELALGADGEYLKSNGTTAAPSWGTPTGGAHDAVTLAGQDYLSLATQQITANLIKGSNINWSTVQDLVGDTQINWTAVRGITGTNINWSLIDEDVITGVNWLEYSYSLPTATDSVKGGVKVGSGLSISSEVLSADTPTDVHITAAPGTDHTASGKRITLTANENQAFGDVVYINADGEAQLADADAIATGKVMAMAVATIAGNASGTYLLQGIARDDTWNWTVGGFVYLSTTGTTGNTLTQTAPSGEDDCVVIIGIATHADRIYFNPQLVIVEYKA